MEVRTLLATVTWVGGNGDRDTGANWSTGVVPGPADDAVINVAGITVTHIHTNADKVHSLTSSATLDIGNGSLFLSSASSINAPLNLTGGTLTGTGNLTVAGLFTCSTGTPRARRSPGESGPKSSRRRNSC